MRRRPSDCEVPAGRMAMQTSTVQDARVTMARSHSLGSTLLAILLAIGLFGVAVALSRTRLTPHGSGARTEPLYTVAQLSGQLTAHPDVWVGREVQVRAVAVVVPVWVSHETLPFRLMVPRLVDPEGGGGFPLVLGPEDRVLGALRRLPIVGGLVPPPQMRVWERPAIYWIRLEAARSPGYDPYAAVLLDTRPGDT